MAVNLHHEATGPPDAPVVVLGPSLGTDLHLFDGQLPALATDYRVVRFDLRGHGKSPATPGPYTIGDLAGDVLALMDALGVDRFAYVGVSIGGAIGQRLAVHHGDRLTKLVVIASAARFPDPPSWAERAARVRADGTDFLVPSRTGAWFTERFAANQPDHAEALLTMLRTTSHEGYAGCAEAIGTFDVRGSLGAVTVPTLVIAGQADPATPVDTCRAIADAIPNAEFLVAPDASHLVNVEAPGLVNSAIRRHLSHVETSRR